LFLLFSYLFYSQKQLTFGGAWHGAGWGLAQNAATLLFKQKNQCHCECDEESAVGGHLLLKYVEHKFW
jgi:hypothetical protein